MLEETIEIVQPKIAAGRRVFEFHLLKDSGTVVANWMYVDADNNDLHVTKTVEKNGADFIALCQQPTLANETVYEAMRRIIYEYMA